MKRLVIIGAGGFAREVAWLVRDINAAAPQYRFEGYVVSDLSKLSDHDSRDQVLGDFNWLQEHAADVDCLAMGIGNPGVKLTLGAELQARVPNATWPNLIHPGVRFDQDSATFGIGVVLCSGVIGTVNLRFEDWAMVNLSCTIGHEAVIGAGAVLNPTVNVSGGVRIGRGVLVGTGAQLLQYVNVGDGAVIGAGAVVLKDVAPGDVMVGIPAKPMKTSRV